MRPMEILVVDDERAVRDSLRRALELEGYGVELAEDGEQALRRLELEPQPDAVILDILMPGADGLEVCRRLRRSGNEIPVLMLTARAEVDSRVAGLDAGADDYLPKPFALAELLARLRALLRRLGNGDGAADTLRFADLELDPGTREVRRGGDLIDLTRTEFALLELFLRNPRQVLTRSVIFERVWGYDFGPTSNSLDVYIGYLRRKTELGGKPRLIHTVRGVGYALRERDELPSAHRDRRRGGGRAGGRRSPRSSCSSWCAASSGRRSTTRSRSARRRSSAFRSPRSRCENGESFLGIRPGFGEPNTFVQVVKADGETLRQLVRRRRASRLGRGARTARGRACEASRSPRRRRSTGRTSGCCPSRTSPGTPSRSRVR